MIGTILKKDQRAIKKEIENNGNSKPKKKLSLKMLQKEIGEKVKG